MSAELSTLLYQDAVRARGIDVIDQIFQEHRGYLDELVQKRLIRAAMYAGAGYLVVALVSLAAHLFLGPVDATKAALVAFGMSALVYLTTFPWSRAQMISDHGSAVLSAAQLTRIKATRWMTGDWQVICLWLKNEGRIALWQLQDLKDLLTFDRQRTARAIEEERRLDPLTHHRVPHL